MEGERCASNGTGDDPGECGIIARNGSEGRDELPAGATDASGGGAVISGFSDHITNLFVTAEELRRHCLDAVSSSTTTAASDEARGESAGIVTAEHCGDWQRQLEAAMSALDTVARLSDDTGGAELERDMLLHCHGKCLAVAQQVLEASFSMQEEPEEEDEDDDIDDNKGEGGVRRGSNDRDEDAVPVDVVRREGQAAVARLTEINLLLLTNAGLRGMDLRPDGAAVATGAAPPLAFSTARDIIRGYVQFQRRCLRLRAKPAIARLVQRRQRLQQDTAAGKFQGSALLERAVVLQHDDHDGGGDDDDEDDPNRNAAAALTGAAAALEQWHAPVLTSILGQAAALIHPLIMWKHALPPPPPVAPQRDDAAPSAAEEPPMAAALRTMCADSITTLDEQAQSLVSTVQEWFWRDRPVDDWMKRSVEASAGGGGGASSQGGEAAEPPASGGASASQQHRRSELSQLDGLLEEMAFGCQVMARYQDLMSSAGQSPQPELSRQVLPEWCWKYASLERYLVTEQWRAALSLASPVSIVLGAAVRVPSTVEDAHYLSTKALERAANTRSLQAVGTVAHAVSHDVWSTDEMAAGGASDDDNNAATTRTIFQAVVVDRVGCWKDPAEEDEEQKQRQEKDDKSIKMAKSGSSSAFASALLDALDDDLKTEATSNNSGRSPPHSTGSRGGKKKSSAPSSGNFLSAFVGGGGADQQDAMIQMQLDTAFCVLNGIQAAATACQSLQAFLDGLLPQQQQQQQLPDGENNGNGAAAATTGQVRSGGNGSTSMIALAREELHRYAGTYERVLQERIEESVKTWCGGDGWQPDRLCLDAVREFLAHERYDWQDAGSFGRAESDERLREEFLGPLDQSRFLSQLSGKCEESHVLVAVGRHLVTVLVRIFLDTLWSGKGDSQHAKKAFTDWGSLLLSKQVRMLQAQVAKILTPAPAVSPEGLPLPAGGGGGGSGALAATASATAPLLLGEWERLSQAVTILQLERPSDWLQYNYHRGRSSTGGAVLTAKELGWTMSLRSDFSADAVQKVVSQVEKQQEEEAAAAAAAAAEGVRLDSR